MRIEERKYNVYISDDGREFSMMRDHDPEAACKNWEEEVRQRKKFHEFVVDREKLNNYKPENWEHVKWWFLRMCQTGGEQHVQHRRETESLFRMEEFYDSIKSEEDIKNVILETINSDKRDKKISLMLKHDGWLDSTVPGGNVLDIYLTLFYNEGSLLHDMKEKGKSYLDWFIRLSQNKSFKRDNMDVLSNLKDIKLDDSSLIHAISESFMVNGERTRGDYKKEEHSIKIGDEVIYKSNGDKDKLSNNGRIIYYMFKCEKEIIDSMIVKFINDGGDVDELLKKSFLSSFNYGKFELEYHKKHTNLFHYLLQFTKDKSKSYWHNNTIKDIYKFNEELRSWSRSSDSSNDEVKTVLDKNIIRIFIDYFRGDKMRLGEDRFVKRLIRFMDEEEIITLIIKSNGEFLKDTSYYEIAKGLFNELLEEYESKGLIIKGRDGSTYCSSGENYFNFTPIEGFDREEYRKNLMTNGAYTKSTMRLERYNSNSIINIVYKKSAAALNKRIQKGEKAKFKFTGDRTTSIYPVYRKDFKLNNNKGSNYLIV